MTQKKKQQAKAKKERVLHTRIPAVLEQELKQLAENLRVPVSNLVRTVLQDAVAAADAVSRAAEEELRGAAELLKQERDRLRDIATHRGSDWAERTRRKPAEDAAGDPAPSPPPALAARVSTGDHPLAEVIGFQALVLAVDAICAGCGRQMEAGQDAFLGVRDTPGPRVIVGRECLPGRKGERR